jgi:hypothetical protein
MQLLMRGPDFGGMAGTGEIIVKKNVRSPIGIR